MARMREYPGEVDRPEYPKTQSTQGSGIPRSFFPNRSSQRTVVYDSEDEDDARSSKGPSSPRKHAPPSVKAGAKKPRRKRMLKGLDVANIYTPDSADESDDDQFVSNRNDSGLKAPTPDEAATRRSHRREARKPVVYDMSVHPQDHSIPGRHKTFKIKEAKSESPPSSPYRQLHSDGRDDVILAPHDSDVEIVEDSSAPRFPTPDERATRRSGRAEAGKAVHYNMAVHPNDKDIGIPTGRKRKRAIAKPKPSSSIDLTGSSNALRNQDDDQQPQSNAAIRSPTVASNAGSQALFSELNVPRPIRYISDESNAVNVRQASQLGEHLSNISISGDLDAELLDSFNNEEDVDRSKTIEGDEPRPPQPQQPVRPRQRVREHTPDFDAFSAMLTQVHAHLSPQKGSARKRLSDSSVTLSENSDPDGER